MLAELALGGGATVIGQARDVTLKSSAGIIDVTSRASAGWKEKLQGLREWSVSAGGVWIPDDTGLELIFAAYIAGTILAMTMKHITGATGHGYSGNVIVTGWGEEQPLEGGIMVPMEFEGAGALAAVDPA